MRASEPLDCLPCNASKFLLWLETRGGLAIWQSLDLSNLGSCTTPANSEQGTPTLKPHWKYENTPSRIITSPSEVIVTLDRECKRVKIALQRGQGFNIVLTDNSSRKVREALAKAGEGSRYSFEEREAVIYKPFAKVSLKHWRAFVSANCKEGETEEAFLERLPRKGEALDLRLCLMSENKAFARSEQ